MSSEYATRHNGALNTLSCELSLLFQSYPEHRVFIEHNDSIVSSFHDIPLSPPPQTGHFQHDRQGSRSSRFPARLITGKTTAGGIGIFISNIKYRFILAGLRQEE
ncbi:hypothetical protein BDQ17DRAFT_1421278 [Cyathus striatus]|nr:hypothetical protein BDQ17DRAFT_1421278 [Cyathus striatus]